MNKPINGFEYIYQDNKGPRTLVLLHGTGGDERDLLPVAAALDPTAKVLSPRGKVREGNMPRFFRRRAEGVFDREDLKVRSEELGEFIKECSYRYGFDLNSVVAVGYSNGANIALHLIASNPRVLNKGILMRPMSAALPDEIPGLSSVRLLILAGIFDNMVKPEDADNLAEVLSEKGAQVEAMKINAGHGLADHDIVRAKDWLGRLSS